MPEREEVERRMLGSMSRIGTGPFDEVVEKVFVEGVRRDWYVFVLGNGRPGESCWWICPLLLGIVLDEVVRVREWVYGVARFWGLCGGAA